MPGNYPSSRADYEAQLEHVVAGLFREHGWKVIQKPREDDLTPDLIATQPGKKLIIEIKRAAEGRRDRVVPLLSQAAIEAAYRSRNFAEHPIPVAIVGANHIARSVAEEATLFVRKRVPNVAVGLLDLEGFRSFEGHGLEALNAERQPALHPSSSSKSYGSAPQLFSDLNQWMLKVLLAPGISESYLSAPRGYYEGPSQLAEAAGVSVMSAFRFVEEFSKEEFVDSSSGRLRIIRSHELKNRWQAANQRRVLDIPLRLILDKGRGAFLESLRSYQLYRSAVTPDRQSASSMSSFRPRICLGLFEAAEMLGLGFVRGPKPYLYLEQMSHDALERLGLSINGAQEQPDIFVRVPGKRESIFRGTVLRDGVPVSDIVQIWLDVAQHASRGKEQADLIWRRVLAHAFEGK